MFNFNNWSKVPKMFFIVEVLMCLGMLGVMIYYSIRNTMAENYSTLFMWALVILVVDMIGRYIVFQSEASDKGFMPISEERGPHFFYRDFHNGMCIVERVLFAENTNADGDIHYSFINDKGEYITDKWFDGVSEFFDEGVAIVMEYDGDGSPRYNVINKDGGFLMINWVYDIGEFESGLAKIFWEPDSTINYIRPDGTLLWKEWKKSFKHNSLEDAYRNLNASGDE